MKFELLIFDWDGTLADSAASIVNAMQAAINDLALAPRTDAEIRRIIGLGLLEAITVLFPESSLTVREQLAQTYRSRYVSLTQGKTCLFPATRVTLDALRARNYQMAIATGKSRKGLDHALRETGIEDFFRFSRCADETFSKPHPQMLLEIMERLMIAPGQTLMIGDSEYDLQMAANAGVRSLAVSYGTQSRERLLEYQPLACLERIDELLQWLPAPRQNQEVKSGNGKQSVRPRTQFANGE